MSAEFEAVCTVPCKPMDEKLESVGEKIAAGFKDRVTWKVFTLVVGGIGTIALVTLGIFMTMIGHNQDAINTNQKTISASFAELKADVRVQTSQMMDVKNSLQEVRRELSSLNGGRIKWEKSSP